MIFIFFLNLSTLVTLMLVIQALFVLENSNPLYQVWRTASFYHETLSFAY